MCYPYLSDLVFAISVKNLLREYHAHSIVIWIYKSLEIKNTLQPTNTTKTKNNAVQLSLESDSESYSVSAGDDDDDDDDDFGFYD